MSRVRTPNKNEKDACCRCGTVLPTPADPENPEEGELHVWGDDPPQWICGGCKDELEAE